MKILESVISFLQFEMVKPTMYGWFHLLSIAITIILIIYLVKRHAKNDRKVLLVMSSIMILLEVYKQVSYSYSSSGWEYQWYAFPFQFCSTPMYIAFIASFVKNEKLKKALYSFLATFGVVAGISVMAYPLTVFISETLINIQTMVHHGFMIVIGMYLLLTDKVELNLKTVVHGAKVFLILVLIAFFGNIISYKLNIDGGLELFYISPYHTSILPIFDIIFEKVPYFVFLVIYIVVFGIGASIPLEIVKLIKEKSIRNINNKKSNTK